VNSTPFQPEQSEPSSHEPAFIGRILDGRLRILQHVGQTSAGPVYRAEYLTSGVEVTLVLLRAGVQELFPEDSARLARLLQQLRRATEIDHPNVSAVLGVDETPDGLAYAIVEAPKGKPLAKILAAHGACPFAEAVSLTQQAAAGLQAVHEAGLVHGDLSPASLLIIRTAEGRPLVKLIGFALTAPSGADQSDRAADVLNLAAVFQHLLTGAPPGARIWAQRIPQRARAFLAKALSDWPAYRFQTVPEFSAALQELSTGPAWSRAVPYAIAAVAGLTLAVGSVWLRWGPQQRTHSGVPTEVAVSRVSADSDLSTVVGAAGQPIEGTWRLTAHREGTEILRPPRVEGLLRVRDGLILVQLRRTVGDTLFEWYGSGTYSESVDRFSYGYDRMVGITRRPRGLTRRDTLPFEGRREFGAHTAGPGVRYEAGDGLYTMEVVGDTLTDGTACVCVRRWVRVPSTRSRP